MADIGALVLSGHIGGVDLYQCAHEQVHGWQVVVVTSPVDGFVEIHPGQTTVLKPDKRRAYCLLVARPEARFSKTCSSIVSSVRQVGNRAPLE
jgi:hypothetical protein